MRRLALLLVLAFPAPAAAQEPIEDAVLEFRSAGEAYEKGRLQEALRNYEKLVRRGYSCPALLFNIGNTHYRLGSRGKAILWYERARRMAPRDGDILYNLKLARRDLEREEGLLWELLDRFIAPAELPWTAAAFLWLVCGTAGWALWRGLPWTAWRSPFLVSLALFAAFSLWWTARFRDLNAPWAVVTAARTEVRSGPGEQFTAGFTAPMGQRVLIMGARPGWVEIGVPSRGLKGWTGEDAVEPIGGGDR